MPQEDPPQVVKRWDDDAEAIFNTSKNTTAIFFRKKKQYSNSLPIVPHPLTGGLQQTIKMKFAACNPKIIISFLNLGVVN
jgi:hypothetical protein